MTNFADDPDAFFREKMAEAKTPAARAMYDLRRRMSAAKEDWIKEWRDKINGSDMFLALMDEAAMRFAELEKGNEINGINPDLFDAAWKQAVEGHLAGGFDHQRAFVIGRRH